MFEVMSLGSSSQFGIVVVLSCFDLFAGRLEQDAIVCMQKNKR
jgi:hypothetical protein